MPHISKRRNQINNLPRKKGRFITQDETQEVTEVQTESTLRMGGEDEIGTLPVKRVYSKDSRTTIWRRNKKKEEDEKKLQNNDISFTTEKSTSSNILLDTEASSNMLLDAEASSNMLPDDEASNDTLLDAEASSNISLLQSSHETLQSPPSPTDTASILRMRLDDINKQYGQGKMNASIQIAKMIWNKGDYMSRCIRKWGDLYIKSGELLSYRQGKHKKSISLLDDDNFLEGCQEWLRQQSPESRSPRALKMYIEETLLPKIGHTKDIISEKTCHTYMHALGYKYDERKKGVYYDGHERPDVVLYRKGWLERMFKYKKGMKDFTGDMLEVIVEPELEYGEKESVQVTHDECHFYANDGQRRIWTREDEDVLRSKHMGRSVMVSAFVCPCHRLLQLLEEQFLANPHVKYRDAFVVRSIKEEYSRVNICNMWMEMVFLRVLGKYDDDDESKGKRFLYGYSIYSTPDWHTHSERFAQEFMFKGESCVIGFRIE
ncbi:8750_t:CDS:2 [Dentiscutata erythropus]|uniref:8750_t:CDS:1 n=1 Tax=Dentiscutata erythropus TaxID=1348616 RepID=A0A9N8WGL6_9GLOM|nr:8750_t:CDS:2 [Dentiscutata erythropus]